MIHTIVYIILTVVSGVVAFALLRTAINAHVEADTRLGSLVIGSLLAVNAIALALA